MRMIEWLKTSGTAEIPASFSLFAKHPTLNFKIDPETGVSIRIYVASREIKSTIHILK